MPILPVALVVTILTPPCPLVGAVDSICNGTVSLRHLSATLFRGISHHWANSWGSAIPLPWPDRRPVAVFSRPDRRPRCLQPADTAAVARGMRASQAYANGAVTNRA